MGLNQIAYLNGQTVYACKFCNTHMSTHESLVNENFQGQYGKAFLFSSVANIEAGQPEERTMTTGRHVVRDIICRLCHTVVGWKYDLAYEKKEEYKIGKYILEMELMRSGN